MAKHSLLGKSGHLRSAHPRSNKYLYSNFTVRIEIRYPTRLSKENIQGTLNLLEDKFKAHKEPEIQKALKIACEIVSKAKENPISRELISCKFQPEDSKILILALIRADMLTPDCSHVEGIIETAKSIYMLYFLCRLAIDGLPNLRLNYGAFKDPDFYGALFLNQFVREVQWIQWPYSGGTSPILMPSQQMTELVDLNTINWLYNDLLKRLQLLPG
jgi:hypothetical protein